MELPPLEGTSQAEIVVIGAGLAGAAAAFELARSGRRVVLLEAEALSAGADVGHVRVGLGVCYREAVRRLGREAAREVWESGRSSRARLEQTLPGLSQGCGYRSAGGFRLAETRAEALALAESEDLLREDGFSGEFLDHYMLEARFDVRGFAGGYWAADDAELEPDALLGGLARAARACGAAVHEQSRVVRLDLSISGATAATQGGRVEAGLALVAAGAGSLALLPWLAGRLTAREERQLRRGVPPGARLPSPGSMRDGMLAWRTEAGAVRIGGPRPEDLVEGGAFALSGSANESARGASAVSRDGLPLVGWLPGRPAGLACGFGGSALGLAFGAARWLAEGVAGRDVVPAPFRADREPASGR